MPSLQGILVPPTPSALCDEIHRLFSSGGKAGERQLFATVHMLFDYLRSHRVTVEAVECICTLERRIVSTKGANKQIIEERLFQALLAISDRCKPDEPIGQRVPLDDSSRGTSQEIERYRIANLLVDLSRWTLPLNIPRDRFNSKRKALAIELLGLLSECYDIPDALEICEKAIASEKKDLILAGVESYQKLLRIRKAKPAPMVLHLLDEIIMKTSDRSVAVTALNFQVETGVIHEGEALSRIDDWKDKNYRM